MDSSDETIVFDDQGHCDYCNNYYSNILPVWNHGLGHDFELEKEISKIKSWGEGREYDCIIGVSGGLDSSYLVHKAVKSWGLKPMLYHVDAGWNTELSSKNISNLVEGLGLDLYTDVINWKEMKDLQRAFFKSGVPDIDTPQDLVFFSSLYNFAARNGIRYILTGGNHSTECVREPLHWGAYYQTDLRYVRDIHKRFGEIELKTLPMCDILKYKFIYRYVKGIRVVKPLDLIPFTKISAENELREEYGWEPYQHKHFESRFTRFFEAYWLPLRFGFDKRKNQFSSLVLTGQLERDVGINRLSELELPEENFEQELEFVADKLGFSKQELKDCFELPLSTFRDFRNKYWILSGGAVLANLLGLEKRKFK